jgi:hypothetical protein
MADLDSTSPLILLWYWYWYWYWGGTLLLLRHSLLLLTVVLEVVVLSAVLPQLNHLPHQQHMISLVNYYTVVQRSQ